MVQETIVQGRRLVDFLVIYGANLIRIEHRPDGVFDYVFEDNDTLREAVGAFEKTLSYGFY